MNLNQPRYARMPDIELRSIAGESFLIAQHAGESKMFSLNGTGLWFWREIETPSSRKELRDRLLAAYEVSEPDAEREVDRFMAYLVEKRLAQILA